MIQKIFFPIFFSIGLFSSIAFSRVTINDINSAIKAKNANWQADQNHVFNLPEDAKARMLGLIITQDDRIRVQKTQKFKSMALLPSKLDWRNKDGFNWDTSVKNQGYCGSCVAFGIMSTFETQYNITNKWPNYNIDLSEQRAFSCGGYGCNGGWTLAGGLSFLKQAGVPDEGCVPYKSGNIGQDLTCQTQTCSSIASRTIKILSYKAVTSWSADEFLIKEALQKGPVFTGMMVYADFMAYRSGVYKHVVGDKLGGHAITIVGYDDENRSWIVRNSWGVGWGESGYFRISYDDEDTGLGGESYSVEVPKQDGYVKVLSPEHFQVLSGLSSINIENTFAQAKEVNYTLTKNSNIFSQNKKINPSKISSFEIDTTKLSDGIYDLSAYILIGDQKKFSTHNLVYILNSTPKVNLAMTNPLNGSVVKDRVLVQFTCSSSPVPLTDLVVVLKGPEGEKRIPVQDPCPKIIVSWRTTAYANGKYEVYAIGAIGKVYKYETNHATVTVGN